MNKSLKVLILIFIILVSFAHGQEGKRSMINTLLITGGHDFEDSFYDIFDGMENIHYDTLSQPQANQLMTSDQVGKYDVLVFYDMWQNISEQEKEGFLHLLEKGSGIIFLHHSLVSYQKWSEYKNIIGGKYVLEESVDNDRAASTYKHDLILNVKVVDITHAVTNGLKDFQIRDEGYKGIEILSSVQPLLSVYHSDCTEYVAWAHKYKNSKIVYILLGHDHHAYQNANYRQLIQNAIFWVSGASS
jgi:type 1 glutamine amidotransferase